MAQDEILELLEEYGELTVSQIAAALNKSKTTVGRSLNQMVVYKEVIERTVLSKNKMGQKWVRKFRLA